MKTAKIFKRAIEGTKHIVITTHIEPDADGIGSSVALCLALRQLGKKVLCVQARPLLERYRYLDPQKTIISASEFKQNDNWPGIDLMIVTDAGSVDRIGAPMQELAAKAKNLLFVDHHPCPKELAAIHCIDPKMAATGELVGRLINSLGIKFDTQMALPLYTSILIDTSSFRYPTVSADTHRLIAKLIDSGIQTAKAYNKIYGAKGIGHIKLLGEVLSSVKCNKAGSVAWLTLPKRILEKYQVELEDALGFINHLLILSEVKVVCMFFQLKDRIKVSLRSRGDTDVGAMARALGGGGHNHAAATVLPCRHFDQAIGEIVGKIEAMLNP